MARLDDIEPRVRIRNQKVVCTTAAAYIVTVTGTDGAIGKLTANTIVYVDVKEDSNRTPLVPEIGPQSKMISALLA
jgi:uncharacterized NAD-dependent epimerase/dehydratase family protein